MRLMLKKCILLKYLPYKMMGVFIFFNIFAISKNYCFSQLSGTTHS